MTPSSRAVLMWSLCVLGARSLKLPPRFIVLPRRASPLAALPPAAVSFVTAGARQRLPVRKQAEVVIAYYLANVLYLSHVTVGSGRAVGLDTLLGLAWLFGSVAYQEAVHRRTPWALGEAILHPDRVPWRRPRQHPLQTFVLIVVLLGLYICSGLLQPAISTLLHIAAAFVPFPVTAPMQRSLLVLIAHLCWVLPALAVMRSVRGFFDKPKKVLRLGVKRHIALDSPLPPLLASPAGPGTATVPPPATAADAAADTAAFPRQLFYSPEDLQLANELGTNDPLAGVFELTAEGRVAVNGDAVGDTGIIEMPPSRPRGVPEEKTPAVANDRAKGEKNTSKGRRYGRVETPGFWKPRGKEYGTSDWMTLSTAQSNWAWWVVAGYSVSVLVFSLADGINDRLVPPSWADAGQRADVVSHILASGSGAAPDPLALFVGALAPCLSAPIFEELLFRGLILPWLSSLLPVSLATPLSSLLFAASHARADTFLPLFALGLTWTVLYLLSGNLFVSMLVHALWNGHALWHASRGVPM